MLKYLIALILLNFSLSVLGNENESKLKISKLADNVYQHISYKNVEPWGLVAASGLVVITGKDAHIIDTPWTFEDTKQLINWVESKGFTVKSSVVTHFHQDASGGIPILNELNIKTFATKYTNQLLQQQSREQASESIITNSFELVKGTVEVFYPGAGHSKDNIVIWLPKVKLLFGGCFVKSLNSKNLGYTGDSSISDWAQSIQNVTDKYPNIEVVVPGHGNLGGIELLQHTDHLVSNALAK